MIHRTNRRSAAIFIVAAAAFGSLLSFTAFSQPAPKPPGDTDPVVARVLNTEIRSSQKKRLGGIIYRTLLEKYAKDHGLSASEEEIAQFRLNVFTSTSADSSGPRGESSDSKEEIESESEIARNVIVAWKVNLALFRKYGGRVSFQQMGYEPIDAYKAFFEEQKRLGAFEIIDKSLEPGFWAYFISENHKFTTGDGEEVLRKRFWERK